MINSPKHRNVVTQSKLFKVTVEVYMRLLSGVGAVAALAATLFRPPKLDIYAQRSLL